MTTVYTDVHTVHVDVSTGIALTMLTNGQFPAVTCRYKNVVASIK